MNGRTRPSERGRFALIGLALFVVAMLLLVRCRYRRQWMRLAAQLTRLRVKLSLRTRLKILATTFQILCSIDSVYKVPRSSAGTLAAHDLTLALGHALAFAPS